MPRRPQIVIPFAHNNSLSFDGASEYLRNVTDTAVGIANEWTIALWIKFTVVPASSSRIINFKAGVNNQNQIDLWFSSDDYTTNLVLYEGAGTIFKNYTWTGINNNFELGVWYHLVFTSDGTTLTHYKNGKVLTPSTTSVDNVGTMGDNARRSAVGATIAGANVSNFMISSLFVYSIVFTAAEVRVLYNGGSGNLVRPTAVDRLNLADETNPLSSLVQAWLMGTDASIVTNLVTGGIDLTLNKAAALTAEDVTTDAPVVSTYTFAHNFCLDFSGSAENIKNSTNNTLGIADEWTIALWIKPMEASFASNRFIFNAQNSGNGNDRIDIRHAGNVAGDPLVVGIHDSGGTNFKTYNWDNLINTSTAWQHIVVTWDGTNLKLYSDGSIVTPSSTPTDNAGTMSTGARRVAFASTHGGATLWVGRGHSVAMWARALTAADVAQIYNGGDGSNYDIKTNMPSNLKHWWLIGTTGIVGRDNVDGDGAGVRLDLALNSTGITEADDRIEDAP